MNDEMVLTGLVTLKCVFENTFSALVCIGSSAVTSVWLGARGRLVSFSTAFMGTSEDMEAVSTFPAKTLPRDPFISSPALPEKPRATTKVLPPFNLPCISTRTKCPEAVILVHFAEDERT